MKDEQVVKDRNDLEMMKRPHLWPNSVLPLKKRDDWREQAFLKPNEMILYIGNIFIGSEKQISFEKYEDLISEGWIVD